MLNEFHEKFEDVERENRRLSRKILKLEKRLELFDEHETEQLMNRSYARVSDLNQRFQTLFTKITVFTELMWFVKDQPERFDIMWRAIQRFDDDDRFWTRADEMTLEELERVFKS